MIVYYSATGNTEWMARRLSTFLLDETVISLSRGRNCVVDALRERGKGERVVFCFPIHGWGILRPVREIVESLPEGLDIPDIYMVCTCGDDIGHAHDIFRALLASKGYRLKGAYSVQMPNTYVNLPFFDIDKGGAAKDKLSAMDGRVQKIAEAIGCSSERDDVVMGSMALMKSGLLRKLFYSCLIDDRFFKVTDSCIGCGLCARVCPESDIMIVDSRPSWSGRGVCTTCMSCYHHCPRHAIEFGRFTKNKGQYDIKDFNQDL